MTDRTELRATTAVDKTADRKDTLPDSLGGVERLTAVVRRVRELHRESRGSMSALYPSLICECGKDYPCPTIRALDATPETGGES